MPDYLEVYRILFFLLGSFVVLLFLLKRLGFVGVNGSKSRRLVIMESGFLSRQSRYHVVKLGDASLLVVEGSAGVFVKDVVLEDI